MNTSKISRKRVEPVLIASIRYCGGSECAPYFQKLSHWVAEYVCGKRFSLYSRTSYQKVALELEFCVPVREDVAMEAVTCRMLPGGDVLSVVHYGAYDTLGKAWEELFDYIERNNIQVQWPHREIYLDDEPFDSPQHITELQVPLIIDTPDGEIGL